MIFFRWKWLERKLTGGVKPEEWHRHPEQVRYRRGFWNGVLFGMQLTALLLWLALAISRGLH